MRIEILEIGYRFTLKVNSKKYSWIAETKQEGVELANLLLVNSNI